MTPQERELLESLANRIANTPSPQKDPEAEALIRERIGSRPDALYILAQTALIQEIALNQANSRLELQQRLAAQGAPQHASFLGRLFGAPQAAYAPRPQYAPQQPYPQPYQPAYPSQPGAGSSFLQSAAATATGVAAGALAFEGIEALLHPHGYGAPFGGGGEFLAGAPNETIINNYHDSSRDDTGGRFASDDGSSADQSDTGDDSSTDDISDSGDFDSGDTNV